MPDEMRGSGQPTSPVVKVQKMMPADDPEACLNTFEHTATAAVWAPQQWAVVLIPYLNGASATSGGHTTVN